MKFEFELDGIDSEILCGMIHKAAMRHYMHAVDVIAESHIDDIVLSEIDHRRVVHSLGLVRNADHIGSTVFGKWEETDLTGFEAYGCRPGDIDFPED